MDRKLRLLEPPAPLAQASHDPRPELDAGTVARAQRGDDAACRALVERHQQPVFAVIARVVGPRGQLAVVPDLAQETFLRVFRHLSGFAIAGPGRLSSWVLTIATRVALDHLKRRKLDLVPAVEAVAEPEVELRQTAVVVERAIETMAPALRAVLLLRVVHELPYEDIARELGLELGTVKSRLARARALLWQALAGDEP
jgi:RNA polymerase sigma-70 factor, ECF subfamily